MGSKKKGKKPNPKRERYAQFHKEKSSSMEFKTPDLTPEQVKDRQADEEMLNKFWRWNRNPPTKEVKEKKLKRK